MNFNKPNMKYLNYLLVMSLALGVMLSLNSCGSDDSPEPEDNCTFEKDANCFCTANPFDDQCCTADQNVDCYCTTGDNATTDTENCCLKDYNLECYCTNNPDDADCEQDFGVGNGLGLILDFEADAASVAADMWNPSGKVTFEEDANIPAIEGSGYISAIWEVDEEGRGWHDFKYDPNEGSSEATIDFSNMANPTVNFWVNSGPNEADTLGFTIAFWGKDDGNGGNDGTDHPVHPLFKVSTGGEWKLMSFPISDMEGQYGWSGDPIPVDLTAKYKLIKFAFLPDSWHIQGRYVAYVDAISITDGPLEQLPWVK